MGTLQGPWRWWPFGQRLPLPCTHSWSVLAVSSRGVRAARVPAGLAASGGTLKAKPLALIQAGSPGSAPPTLPPGCHPSPLVWES